MCDFPDFWAIPFDTKVIFFTKEKMNSNICHDTLVGIPEYLQKHQDVLLSIEELPTFYIANVRFSRFLSHPFWHKSHFFHKRKDEFEHLSRYTCWHAGVPSQTPGRVALHRRTSYILHCKDAIFMIFEPSLLIQKSFFSQKKRWIRKSVKMHLLVYKSTFKNTRTCCSPSQNFLHFTLQRCDFPDFWAIPFDTKVIFFTKEKKNSKICHDPLVGIPASLHKHREVLLSIAELPTFYIAKVRFSRFLSHPFWHKSHFFHKRIDEFEHLSQYTCWHTRVPSHTPGRVAPHRRTSYIIHCKRAIFPIFEPSLLIQKSFFSQKKRWIRTSVTIHLLAYQSTFTNTRTSCSPSQNFLHFSLQRCDFPAFWAIPFDTKDIFFKKKRWIRTSVTIHLLAYQSAFTNTVTCCSPSQNFLHFTLQRCDFPDFEPSLWYKSHLFHKRKDELEHLSRYTCWHTRVPPQTPGRVTLHRRTSYIFQCKGAIFSIFEPSLLIQKSFFSQKKRWIRTSVTIHLLAYQSTFTKTRTCCSPSQNFLHFSLQMCDFPDFWAIPFERKVIFFTKEKVNSNICHNKLVGIPEYLHKHQDVLLPIAELPTFYIAKVRFSRFLSHPFWYKSHFFTKEKMNSKICHDTLVGIPEYLHKHQDVLLPIAELPTFYIAKVRFSRFWAIPFDTKVIFFHKRTDEFEHLSWYTCWHTRVPSQTPGRVAFHRRTSYILHCKGAIFPVFEPSLLIQKSFFSQKKRWIRTSVTIHLLAYQSTFTNTVTCCSPSQNFLHFTLQRCDFPDFEPSLLIQKSFISQKKRWTRTSVTIHLLAYQSTSTNTRACYSPSQNFLHFSLQRCDFSDFEPSLLIQKSFFSQKKRWIRTSVTIHLLAYQSTFTNTRTSCSPSQNVLHYSVQRCDFLDFWAIPFDTKVIFFTKEKMNSNICHDTLVGIPASLHKHREILRSIAEPPTFYIANVRFSRFLSHPFWHKSHFFHKRIDEFEHLSRYTCWHTRVPSHTPGRVAPHRRTSYIIHCKRAIFPIFEPSLLIQKSFFSQKKRWIRKSVMIHLLAYQSTFINTGTSCSPPQNFLHFTLQRCDFPDFWAIPFDTKVIFSQKKRWIRTSDTIHLLAYQSTFTNTRTSCSPSQNVLHFSLQRCDFPEVWAIPFDTKVIFFTKEKMNSNICHDTLVGIPEYLHKDQDVLLSIAELPTFFIANVRFSQFLSHPFW